MTVTVMVAMIIRDLRTDQGTCTSAQGPTNERTLTAAHGTADRRTTQCTANCSLLRVRATGDTQSQNGKERNHQLAHISASFSSFEKSPRKP